MTDTEAPQFGGNTTPRSIEKEMKESYLTYALSVIHSRALPDVRDGLKPSQRRILVAMNGGELMYWRKKVKSPVPPLKPELPSLLQLQQERQPRIVCRYRSPQRRPLQPRRSMG